MSYYIVHSADMSSNVDRKKLFHVYSVNSFQGIDWTLFLTDKVLNEITKMVEWCKMCGTV